MKKLLLLMAGLATATGAMANWGTSIEDPVSVFPKGTNSYATEVRPGADGSAWAVIYHPNTKQADNEYDISRVVYEYRVQYFDPEVNPKFPAEGLLVSDYSNISYTVVNNYLLVDNDGNAIVSVSDCRNSNGSDKSYTVYKISPEGEFLWGEDGIALSDPTAPASLGVCMNIIQLEDGSYVFAWAEYDNEGGSHVFMQRLSHDGKAQWDLAKTAITDEISNYPYLLNSGDNTFILVYGRTASTILYARKLDFEAENVWGKDVRIYRGGWGSTPVQTKLEVKPSGDGGALIAWSDDRSGTNIESAYISYVTPDGKLGFAGASDEGDVKLCYDDWRCFNVSAVRAADLSCFYAVWRRTDYDQRYQAIMMQKISNKGELLWDDEAREVTPTEATTLGYVSVQAAGDNGACAFYEEYRSYFDQQAYAQRFGSEGEFIWEPEVLDLSRPERMASGLTSQPYMNGKGWLCNWADGGTSAEDKETTYYMTVVNLDGGFGLENSGVENVVSVNEAQLTFAAGALHADVADGTIASVYSVDGSLVAECSFSGGRAALDLAPGMYIAGLCGGETVKFIVK